MYPDPSPSPNRVRWPLVMLFRLKRNTRFRFDDYGKHCPDCSENFSSRCLTLCQLDAVVYWKDGTSRSKLISYMITQSTNVEFSISCNYIETVSTDVRTTIRAPNGFNEYSREAISMLHLRRYSGHEMYVTITRIDIKAALHCT